MTAQGQLTIPQSIRQKLDVKAGDRIDFIEDDGRIVVRVLRGHRAADLAGSLSHYADRAPDLDAINAAIGNTVLDDDRRIRIEWRAERE